MIVQLCISQKKALILPCLFRGGRWYRAIGRYVAFETGLMRLMLCARHCNKCQLGTLVKSGTLTGSRPERAAVATLNEVGLVWCGTGGMGNALDAALTCPSLEDAGWYHSNIFKTHAYITKTNPWTWHQTTIWTAKHQMMPCGQPRVVCQDYELGKRERIPASQTDYIDPYTRNQGYVNIWFLLISWVFPLLLET